MVLNRHWKSLARAIAGLGLTLPLGVPAQAAGMSASDAPAEWVSYAQGATAAIEALLRDESQPGLRLKEALSEKQAKEAIVIAVWIDGKGAVERVECTDLAGDAAQADLRALLVGQRLPGKMPRDMVLPMRIAAQLDEGGAAE